MIILIILTLLSLSVLYTFIFPTYNKPLKYFYSILLSVITVSVLYDYSLFFHLSFIGIIIFVFLASAIWVIRKKDKLEFSFISINKLHLAFLVLVIIGTLIFYASSYRWGKWDAYAIWTLHAKFLCFPDKWSLYTQTSYSHPDYPLLLPSIIAVFWRSTGAISPVVPALIAYGIFVSVLLTMFLGMKESRILGLFVIAILITDYNFILYSSFQIADVFLALFILSTFILLDNCNKKSKLSYIFLGAFASFGIWTKNEGIIFFFFFSFLMLVENRKQFSKFLLYCIGTLPIIFLFLFFKYKYSPVNDLVGGQGIDTLSKILDISRYVVVGKFFIELIWNNCQILLIFFFVSLFVTHKKLLYRKLLVLYAVLISYLFVYIVTPHDLKWHLSTSLDRLVLQLTPAFLYLFVKNLMTCTLHLFRDKRCLFIG